MTAIEITGIRIRPLVVPLRRPLTVSFGLFREAPMLAVELETKGGTPGRVLGFTFHHLGLSLLPPVLAFLADRAKGRLITPQMVSGEHDAWQKSLMLLGHEGVTQMALSFFDIAVHDALAKAAGVPLYEMLGARAAQLPAYNSCGGSLLAADDAVREAKELVGEHGGFRHIKLRLGRPQFVDDLDALTAVRSAVGPDLLLSADFNQALPAAHAVETCRALDTLGLYWLEEPVAYDDFETQARLAAKLTTPLQVGETWWQWRVGKRAIERGACDFIMPDLLRIGGVTGWMRLARVAADAGIPMSSHLSPEVSAHVLSATPTRHWLEYMDWGQDLLETPVVPVGGVAVACQKPGAGTDWRETALAKFVVST